MKIVGGKIYALRIPFVEAFAHSLKDRKFSDSFVVRLVGADGTTGFGEGAARRYVTGETVERSLEYIKNRLFPAVQSNEINSGDLLESPILLDEKSSDGVVLNAARAAVEIALFDLILKNRNQSLGAILPPVREAVIYSGVITAGTVETAVKHARRAKLFGIKHLKIKIGADDDVSRVAAIREIVGADVSLRVDANGAYSVRQAIEILKKLAPFGIDAVEQPVPRGEIEDLIAVKKNSPIPVMVDESLVTLDDARRLAETSACDFFNLRLSKCGGIANTLQMAKIAAQAGIGLQIGCQVGETAILSAAGRHVAAHLENVEFVEGSFGNLLLTEDVSRAPINFGYGGRAPVLRGLGLGVQVREEILEKYAHQVINLGKEGKSFVVPPLGGMRVSVQNDSA